MNEDPTWKLLILTGPSQAGKSWTSARYCRDRGISGIEGDLVFDQWFTRIGRPDLIGDKGNLSRWVHLLPDPAGSLLGDEHLRHAERAGGGRLMLEGIMYRHQAVRETALRGLLPRLAMPYGLIDYCRELDDFVELAWRKRPYYRTRRRCRESHREHRELLERPAATRFFVSATTHDEVVSAADRYFGGPGA